METLHDDIGIAIQTGMNELSIEALMATHHPDTEKVKVRDALRSYGVARTHLDRDWERLEEAITEKKKPIEIGALRNDYEASVLAFAHAKDECGGKILEALSGGRVQARG